MVFFLVMLRGLVVFFFLFLTRGAFGFALFLFFGLLLFALFLHSLAFLLPLLNGFAALFLARLLFRGARIGVRFGRLGFFSDAIAFDGFTRC